MLPGELKKYKMTKKIKKKVKSFFSPVFFILLLGLILRLLLYKNGTYQLDVNTFVSWSKTLVDKGFSSFYQNAWSDYLPGYLYVLYLLGKIKELVSIDQLLLFKLPAILADLGTGYLIYKIVANLKNKRLGYIASCLYIFNPAIFANSTLWGQVDSLTILFSLLSIYLLNKNWPASSLSLSVGAAIKPQAAIAAPVVLFVMFKDRWEVKRVAKYILLSTFSTILVFLPFSDKNIFVFIFERIQKTLGQYPYSSVNAFSIWGLGGFWKSDTKGGILSPRLIGTFAFLAISFFSFLKLKAKKNSRYLLLAILFATNFMFFTRMHERHLLPVFAPLVISIFSSAVLWIPYIGFSLSYIGNLYYAYGAITGDFTAFSSAGITSVILFNLIFFIVIAYSMFSEKKEFSLKAVYQELKEKSSLKGKTFSFVKRNSKIILVAVLAFSLLSRLLFLWNPEREYFDEVYHAFTAQRMLHADPKAWEWWNDPPEGFAYEWTHPPVAKLGMVVGMGVFGENAFGWRVPGALLGVVSIYLIYLIAKELLEDKVTALFAAGVSSLSGLLLVMSRIGMNDMYLLTFSLLSFYLYLKEKNSLSAIAFGLAISSKWSAVWLAPIILVSHFVLKRKIKLSYLFFVVIPPAIYLASYIPMFVTGHGIETFIGVQKQMWWYHTRLDAEHSYTSLWWSWPFLVRPIWLYTSGKVSGFIANIYATGNPPFFWGGLLSIPVAAVYSFFEKNKKLGLLIFSYLVFFAPWAMSPRIMFLYHYLPSLPFLAIIAAWVLRRYEKLVIPFFAMSFILFIYFFPHLTGIKIPTWLDNSYYWFNSWK